MWENSRERGLHVVDATCPLVTKVHLEALKYAREGYSILLIGHAFHDEVIGTMGEAPDVSILVEDAEDARTVEVADPDRVVALTQTTLSVDDTAEVIDVLRERFPNILTRNDICYATSNRQEAVKIITSQVDVVLVIGAQNSSNCNRLREVAEAEGVPAYLVNGPEEIDDAWLEGAERVGITSGASTPELLVDRVVEYLKPDTVRHVEAMEENVSFMLPRALLAPARFTRRGCPAALTTVIAAEAAIQRALVRLTPGGATTAQALEFSTRLASLEMTVGDG